MDEKPAQDEELAQSENWGEGGKLNNLGHIHCFHSSMHAELGDGVIRRATFGWKLIRTFILSLFAPKCNMQ